MAVTAAINTTGLSKALKKYYDSRQNLESVIHGRQHRAALNQVTKVGFEGDTYEHPVLADWGGIVTPDFGVAQALAGVAPLIDTFQTGKTIAEDHRVVAIDSQLLGRTKTSKGTFFDRVRLRTDQLLEALADNAERALWSDGYNAIGTVKNTSYATTVLELNEARDAKWFKKGMIVQAVLVGSGIGGSVEAGELTVDKRDLKAGTVTMTANLSTGIATIATDAWLFPKGAAADGGARKGVYGFKAWKDGGASFLGVDTSKAEGILSMNSWTGALSNIYKAVSDADAWALDTVGGRRNWCVFNPQDHQLLAQQQHTQTQHNPGSRTQAGFSYLNVNGASGSIMCDSSPYVPKGEFYLLYKEGWDIVHLWESPIQLDNINGIVAKLPNLSGAEVRGFSMIQLGTKFPGWNVHGTLS
jgi:hypothetical protein